MFTINSDIIGYFEHILEVLYRDMNDVKELCVFDCYRPIVTYPDMKKCTVFNEKWICNIKLFFNDIDAGGYAKRRINGKEIFAAPIEINGKIEGFIAIAGNSISYTSCDTLKTVASISNPFSIFNS